MHKPVNEATLRSNISARYSNKKVQSILYNEPIRQNNNALNYKEQRKRNLK